MSIVDRRRYAALYGPTVGDRLRLALDAGLSRQVLGSDHFSGAGAGAEM